jgi:hypothetical protein
MATPWHNQFQRVCVCVSLLQRVLMIVLPIPTFWRVGFGLSQPLLPRRLGQLKILYFQGCPNCPNLFKRCRYKRLWIERFRFVPKGLRIDGKVGTQVETWVLLYLFQRPWNRTAMCDDSVSWLIGIRHHSVWEMRGQSMTFNHKAPPLTVTLWPLTVTLCSAGLIVSYYSRGIIAHRKEEARKHLSSQSADDGAGQGAGLRGQRCLAGR